MSEIDLSTIDRVIEMYPQSVLLRDIRSALSRADVEYAQVLYHHDGDKLTQYPGAELAVEHYTGCRLHNRHQCQARICTWTKAKRLQFQGKI